MAKFRFTISDAQGSVRTGTMAAPDLATAQQMAVARGFKVIEMVPLPDDAPAPPPAPPSSSSEGPSRGDSSTGAHRRLPIPSGPTGWTDWGSSSGKPPASSESARPTVSLPLTGGEGRGARSSGSTELGPRPGALPIGEGSRSTGSTSLNDVPRAPTARPTQAIPIDSLREELQPLPPLPPVRPGPGPSLTGRPRVPSSTAGPLSQPPYSAPPVGEPPQLFGGGFAPPPDTEGLGPEIGRKTQATEIADLQAMLREELAQMEAAPAPPPPPPQPKAEAGPMQWGAPKPAAPASPAPAEVGAVTQKINLAEIDFGSFKPAPKPVEKKAEPAASSTRDAFRQELEALTSTIEVKGAKLPSGKQSAVKIGGSELSIGESKKGYRSGPVAPLEEYGPSLGDRVAQTLTQGGGVSSFWILGSAAALGLFWFVSSYMAPSVGEKHPHAAYEGLRFACVGNVVLPSGSSFTGVDVVVDFPQIPYHKTFNWSEIKHATPGAYEARVDLKFNKRPDYFTVHITAPGLKEAVSKQVSIPSDADTLSVPDVFVRKP